MKKFKYRLELSTAVGVIFEDKNSEFYNEEQEKHYKDVLDRATYSIIEFCKFKEHKVEDGFLYANRKLTKKEEGFIAGIRAGVYNWAGF